MPPEPKPEFTQFPLLWLAASFSAGILGAEYFDLGILALAIACGLGAIAAIWSMPSRKAAAGLFLTFFAFGGLCYAIEIDGIAGDRIRTIYDSNLVASGEPVAIDGVLRGSPELAHNGAFLRVAATKITYKETAIPVSGDVRLFVPVEHAAAVEDLESLRLSNGSEIRADCALQRELNYQNPGVRQRLEALDEQKIDASATLKSPLQIEKIGDGQGFSLMGAIFEQRQRLIRQFRTTFESRTAGILIASLLGNKYFLDKDTANLFREGGTFHILVISGLHITFIGGLVLLIVTAFTRSRLLQFAITTGFLWSYTIAVGAEVPVVRASLVFTILLFARVIYRQGTLLNSMGGCGLLLLAYRPSSLLTPSFQLTFVSVGAIVAVAFPLIANLRKIGEWVPSAKEPLPPDVPKTFIRFCEMLYWREAIWDRESGRQIWSGNLVKDPFYSFAGREGLQKLAAYLFEGLAVSLIVQICLMPFVVYYFHRVPAAGIILNLWVGAALAAETFLALGSVVVLQISETLAVPLVKFTELMNSVLLLLPSVAIDSGLGSLRVPIYSGNGRIFYFLYLTVVAVIGTSVFKWNPFVQSKRRLAVLSKTRIAAAAALISLSAVIVFHPFSSSSPNGRLRIDFLDVGQGDSALVTFPDGQTMLVDGGGRPDFRKEVDESDGVDVFEPDVARIGEMVVSEYLWEKGYSRIDHIVATHADSDHIQGMADVAANFDIGNAYVAQMAAGKKDFDEFAAALARKKVGLSIISAGDTFEIGGARVEILNPKMSGSLSENDSSIVLRIIYGERSILLTGDIEQAAENSLVADGVPLQSDVVKVAHHGSRTSSIPEFVDAVRPQFAIVSVGKRSPYGHPHAEVVERWLDVGAKVITTGNSGTVTFSTNGTDLLISTYSGK